MVPRFSNFHARVAFHLALSCLVLRHFSSSEAAEPRLAYVALASGQKWLLPARTLGKSIERTGSTIPRVMMLTYSPSAADRALLEGEGWKLRELPRLPNPYNDVGEMTRNTFSTTWIFNLTEYDKVLFIDSDFIVLRNLDHIFDCGVFCAVVSVRETKGRFNGGFMMATPDTELFDFMMHWRENGLHSYNQGAQGFYNEALPLWCSYGKVREWNEIRNKGLKSKAWRKCVSLPEYYNHVAVSLNAATVYEGTWFPPFAEVTDLYSKEVQALHFNHPVFWAVKPWKWIWYPVLPSNWLWWQARRKVPGEFEQSVLLLFRGVVLPIALSIWFCISVKPFSGVSEWRTYILRRSTCCQRLFSCFNPYFEVVLVTLSGSFLCYFLLPPEGDALVAWVSLFVMKGCWLGIFSCQIASQELGLTVSSEGGDKTSHRQLRCWSTVRGYGCASLECVLIWFPQTQGLSWASDRGLSPICQNHGRHSALALKIWDTFGCNMFLLLLVILIGIIGVLLEVCLLCPLWRGKLARSGMQSNDIELASTGKRS